MFLEEKLREIVNLCPNARIPGKQELGRCFELSNVLSVRFNSLYVNN